MAGELICDRIEVERRYVRAVDIARDLPDPHALDGYVLTSRAREALLRLSTGLTPKSTQRAYRITGPYGSGKSSFGLLLAKLTGERSTEAAAIASEAVDVVTFPRFETIVLVGSRTSFAREILESVAKLAEIHFGSGDKQAGRCHDLLGNGDDRPISTKDGLAQLAKLSDRIEKHTGRGLLLLIDEMGRYLEFAAANQDSEDPALFQQLAERASGSAHPHLAVVAFLHHRFDDYLASGEGWTSQEWARSAERYEEIAFSEPREQSIYLIAKALTAKKAHTSALKKSATSLHKTAAKRFLFAISDDELKSLGERLYPLHPAALSCLTMAASRFGQHDRSVFSFLQSSEPAGFLHFAHNTQYGPDNWYQIDHVFDYMAGLGGLRFDSADRDRRWAMGREAVEVLAKEDETLKSVLKSVAVIAALEPMAGIKADADTLAWALGLPERDVSAALAELTESGVLYNRAATGDYGLWSNSSVDLSHWYGEAKRAVSKPIRLDDDIAQIPPLRPVIAQKHYHLTGTLRSFLPAFGEDLPALPPSVDGRIVILPINPGEDVQARRREAASFSDSLGPLALVHTRKVEDADLALSHELKCWNWVFETCEELRMDDLAREEVLRNIASLEQRLQARLSPFSFGSASDDWFYEGQRITLESRSALSRKLSTICDEVFKKAPLLRNELINRAKLSTAIAAARMRLLGLMIKEESKEGLGLEGAPPERTIYRSMFAATGMHCEEDDRKYGFHPPVKGDKHRWHFAWKRIETLVRSRDPVSFEKLIAKLSEPPYGLRAGPALLLIAAVMLHHRTTIALIERGTFQPELTDAHFMRLAKSPKHFALRKITAEKDGEVLQQLASRLSLFADDPPPAELKPVVERIFLWWRSLDEYARTTSQLDPLTKSVRLALKKAKDPIELIFRSLPEACDMAHGSELDADRYVDTLDIALQQLSDALPQLRSTIAARLQTAFGTQSLDDLREQVRLDYQDHLNDLGDYNLRAFVDRAMNKEISENVWIDRIASLIVSKRPESWDDNHPDQFGFEVNRIAQELARRLATLRENAARSAPVTAIHITTSGGAEKSYYIHEGSGADKEALAKLREALGDVERPEAILIEALRSLIAERRREETK